MTAWWAALSSGSRPRAIRRAGHYQATFSPGVDSQTLGTRHNFGAATPSCGLACRRARRRRSCFNGRTDSGRPLMTTTSTFEGRMAPSSDSRFGFKMGTMTRSKPSRSLPGPSGMRVLTFRSLSSQAHHDARTFLHACEFRRVQCQKRQHLGSSSRPRGARGRAVVASTPTVIEPYSSAGPSTILFPASRSASSRI